MPLWDNILDAFSDFPKEDILEYTPNTAFTTSTGIVVTRYVYSETVEMWGYQKGAFQDFMRGKEFDGVDMVLISSETVEKDTIICHGGIWYSVTHPDNVGFANQVYVIGISRIEKPALDFEVLGSASGFMIGDSTGVLGWTTYDES